MPVANTTLSTPHLEIDPVVYDDYTSEAEGENQR